MFILHVEMEFQEGKAEKFCEEIMKIRDIVLKEDGCSKYEPYLTLCGKKAVMLEIWESDAHLETHMKQPHIVELFALTNPWQTGRPKMKKYQLA